MTVQSAAVRHSTGTGRFAFPSTGAATGTATQVAARHSARRAPRASSGSLHRTASQFGFSQSTAAQR